MTRRGLGRLLVEVEPRMWDDEPRFASVDAAKGSRMSGRPSLADPESPKFRILGVLYESC
jgi:hypothetical protein